MVVARRPLNLNSLLMSERVALLTRNAETVIEKRNVESKNEMKEVSSRPKLR